MVNAPPQGTDSTESVPVGPLRDSFLRHLAAENKSPSTRTTYAKAVDQFAAYLQRSAADDVARVGRQDVEGFLIDLQERGMRPATASQRYRSLQQFFRWLTAEHEIASNPMAGMRPPHVPQEPPPVLRPDELKALLAACEGTGFDERRDTAILRLFLDSGMRRAELARLRLEDVEFDHNVAIVMGKARRPRAVPFGRTTAQALDRYMRRRAGHPHAASDWLWPASRAGSARRASSRT